MLWAMNSRSDRSDEFDESDEPHESDESHGSPDALPAGFFERADDTDDEGFYQLARLVTHIDAATIASLRDFYAEVLPQGADVLDLMSSWVSHLPEAASYGRVAGLGMNAEELAANPRLTESVVHDLNRDPELPFEDESLDAVLNAVSVQYLVRPVEVFASIRRVLRPGGVSIVAMSHRCFPTKAIRVFHQLGGADRLQLVSHYHELAGGFDPIEQLDRSPASADPLWLVVARRA
jgi:SAM-dependent methyltransferase